MDLLYNADAIYTDMTHSQFIESTKPPFYIPQRYWLTFMGFLGLVMAYSLRLSLSVAITQMVPPPIFNSANLTNANGEVEIVCPFNDSNYIHEHFDYVAIFDSLYSPDNEVYNWSQEQQGIILSSFFFGYLITQIPGGMLSQRYGGKYVFMLGILFSAVCSLLTPNVVRFADSVGLIVLRFFSGLGQGFMYGGLTELLAAWVPLEERTTLASLAYGGSTVGTIGGTYVAALFIHHYNSWQQVFYVFGLATILWCFLFLALCYNDPDSHPFITDYEKAYLLDELGQQQHQPKPAKRMVTNETANQQKASAAQRSTPWRQILTNAPFIALILCQISHEWAFCVVVLDLPKYMNDVLHFSIQDNGVYSSIPQAIKLILALLTGALNDWLVTANYMTITNSRKVFVAIASIFTGIFIITASYAECDKFYAVAHFTVSIAFQGVPGVAINALDLSPNYASILMGVGGAVTSITGILVPYMVGIYTPNSLLTEWRFIFWITFVLQIAKMFIFSIWGSGDVQPWDSHSDSNNQSGRNSEVRFILPGDETDDEYMDGESSYSSDSDLII